jgi:outer membrane protein assembly factor BamB
MPSRRRVLAASGAIGACALAGCLGSRDVDPDLSGNWLQVGYDASNANFSPEQVLPNGLTEAWRERIGLAEQFIPIVVDGTVFAGGDDGLFAFDAADGTHRWDRDLEGLVTNGAAVDGETLLVTEYRDDNPSRVRGFDLDDGDEQWSLTIDSRPFAPTVVDGRAYLQLDSGCLAVSGGETDWHVEWEPIAYPEYNVRRLGTVASTIAPAATRDRVVVVDQDAIVALDPADGTEQWRRALHGANASPIVLDDTVLGLGLDDVVALDPDGEERWRMAAGRWGTIAAADGEIYVLGAGELTALDIENGEESWTGHVSGDVVRTQPTGVGNAVVATTSRGYVFQRGDPGFFGDRELFEFDGKFGTEFWSSATAGAGRVFACDRNHGDLVAFEPES